MIVYLVSAVGKLIISRSLMCLWMKMCWSLSQIWDQLNHSTCDVVSGSPCMADNWKSGPLLAYLIGDRRTEGKFWIKTWNFLLVEIFHPECWQVNFWREHLIEMKEGEVVRKRDRERKEILIGATIQGKSSAPSRWLCIRRISNTREKQALSLLYHILHFFSAWL